MEYVCGFMFSNDFTRVALIRKNKPAWQAGKLNGIGGKVEVAHVERWLSTFGSLSRAVNEQPHEAMAREFEEETGCCTAPTDWHLYRTECFANGAVVHFLWAAFEGDMPPLRSTTDEHVLVCDFSQRGVTYMRDQLMYNLPYLIEMAVALARLDPHLRPLP